MPASLTVYLLEQVTDYIGFERLCHDLMALEGYPRIEPLGGSIDKGRDAIHVDTSSGKTTIFAYSVREDWQAKLAEDATKIKSHNHKCDNLVFITTSDFTSGERDKAIARTLEDFGYALDLYGIERLRILLDATHPHVKAKHPQIFPSEFLSVHEKVAASETQDYLFLSFAPNDRIFAEWLARKLTAEGYRVWCESYKLLGGERYPNDINAAIKDETFRMLAIYSNGSLSNAEVMRQRATAFNIAEEHKIDFVIPISLTHLEHSLLDKETSALKFIPFTDNWAKGLEQLLKKLVSIDTPQPLANGKSAAAGVFFEKDVLSNKPEHLYSNCFLVKSIPTAIYRFELDRDFFKYEAESFSWAYRKLNDKEVISFSHPPVEITNKYRVNEIAGYSWKDVEKITWTDDGERKSIFASNLVSELIRKSLIAKCHQKGLRFGRETNLHYFPDGLLKRNRLALTLPDGRKITALSACGERKYFRPNNMSEFYRYHLAPTFFIRKDLFENHVALFRLRIHLTDTNGDTLQTRKINSRRKHLCKNWWNDDWFKRMLAVVQFLSEDNQITIGGLSKEQIVLDSTPIAFSSALSVNEMALEMNSYERESLFLEIEDDDDLESGPSTTGDDGSTSNE